MPFYSPSTGGFYTADIHGDAMPGDAVEITDAKHARLLEAQAAGGVIVPGPKGPTARMPSATRADLVSAARRRVKREARRRILAIASLEKQSNDNAAIALAALHLAAGSTEPDVSDALERRRKIDAIRAASNAIEGDLNDLASDALSAFNVAKAAWPTL